MINDQLWGNNATNNPAADSRRNHSNNTGATRRTDLDATRHIRNFWDIQERPMPVLENPRMNEHDARSAAAGRAERHSPRRSTSNSSLSRKRKRQSSSHVCSDEEIELARRPVTDPPRVTQHGARVFRAFRVSRGSSRRNSMISLSRFRGEKRKEQEKQQKKKKKEYDDGKREERSRLHILRKYGDNSLEEQLELASRPVQDPPRFNEHISRISRAFREAKDSSRRKIMISLSRKRSEKREKEQEQKRNEQNEKNRKKRDNNERRWKR